MSIRRIIHLTIFIVTFEFFTNLMGGTPHVLPTIVSQPCDPITLCGCDP